MSFLGLTNVSNVSWGTNLYWAQNNSALLTGEWWTFIPSGMCIALVAFGLTMINYGMDEITNPRLRAERDLNNVLKAASSANSATSAQPRSSGAPLRPLPGELLDVRDLHVEYMTARGPVRAVDGVSFALRPAKCSGWRASPAAASPPSPTRSCACCSRPRITGGNILFGGEDVLAMSEARLEGFRWSDVSMVFQSAMNSLNPVMTIGEQIPT